YDDESSILPEAPSPAEWQVFLEKLRHRGLISFSAREREVLSYRFARWEPADIAQRPVVTGHAGYAHQRHVADKLGITHVDAILPVLLRLWWQHFEKGPGAAA